MKMNVLVLNFVLNFQMIVGVASAWMLWWWKKKIKDIILGYLIFWFDVGCKEKHPPIAPNCWVGDFQLWFLRGLQGALLLRTSTLKNKTAN
jgi:hypothetical protein